MKKVAILQSNYIPWKGYFDLINMVDEFILYDTVQYTRRDWRNRNKIKTLQGLQWLTVPVEVKGKYLNKINEIRVKGSQWAEKHWQSIQRNYLKTKYLKQYKDIFENLYMNNEEIFLSRINYLFIMNINKILGISTKISFSSDYDLRNGKNERLIGLCKDSDAAEYISGPAAKGYLDESEFARENIKVTWMNYDNYPEYRQLYPPFEHNVTILDLIFNEGPNAVEYMKSFGGE